MRTLLSTQDAAKHLGISVQGVHYRIKTNKLQSTQKDGKTFVYIDIEEAPKEEPKKEHESLKHPYTEELLRAKDEQISLLKKALRWIGFQHKREIDRLEENHNKLIRVFQSEVDLLQKAYNEMQNLYKNKQFIALKDEKKENSDTISVKDFFFYMKKNNKTNTQIKQILIRAIECNDPRFVFDAKNQKITIYNSNFKDLL